MADLSITASNVIAAAGAVTGDAVAGATITAGQGIYIDASDNNRAKLTINTSAAAASARGIALHAALAGQPVRFIRDGNLGLGAILMAGVVYGTSDNAGGIRPVSDNGSGDYVTTLGIATTTSNLAVQIQASGAAV